MAGDVASVAMFYRKSVLNPWRQELQNVLLRLHTNSTVSPFVELCSGETLRLHCLHPFYPITLSQTVPSATTLLPLCFYNLLQLPHFWESSPLLQISGFSFSLHLNIWSLPLFDWRTSGVKKAKLGSFQPQRAPHHHHLAFVANLFCTVNEYWKGWKGSVSAVKETDHANLGIYFMLVEVEGRSKRQNCNHLSKHLHFLRYWMFP